MSHGKGGYYATVERRNPWVLEPLHLETWSEQYPSLRPALENPKEPRFLSKNPPISNFEVIPWVKDISDIATHSHRYEDYS